MNIPSYWADSLNEDQQEIVETAAEVLYGLIHARYILTGRGMHRMFDKFQDAEFGTCPRVCCQGQHCLPVGMSDQQRSYPVNVYCPRCQELYYPRSTKQAGLDGAYFGTTFAHMFLLTYPDLIPRRPPTATLNSERYIPKIYGFRIHQDSSYYQLRYERFSFSFFLFLFSYLVLKIRRLSILWKEILHLVKSWFLILICSLSPNKASQKRWRRRRRIWNRPRRGHIVIA